MGNLTLALMAPHASFGNTKGKVIRRDDIDATAFWNNVAGGLPTLCWPWKGTRGPQGYGVFRVGTRNCRAHRVAFVLAKGEIPHGKLVIHSCDNPPCVNPAHLSAGTAAANVADMRKRRRMAYAGPDFESLVCWRHGAARRSKCAVCKLRAQVLPLLRRLRAVEQAHRKTVAERRAAIALYTPTTIDELSVRVGRRRARIFAAYFGLYGYGGMDTSELSNALGVSHQRVHQILSRVREHLASIAPSSAG